MDEFFDCTGTKRTPWEVTAAIRVNKQIFGYIYVQRDKQLGSKFSNDEIDLFHELSEHIDVALDSRRIRDLLACPYIALAMDCYTTRSNDLKDSIESTLPGLFINKEKIVKTIAQRFYRDLHRTGFETRHILSAATEILNNLCESLRNNNPERSGNH